MFSKGSLYGAVKIHDWERVNSLQNKWQTLDSSKLEEFADDNFKFDEKGRKFSKRLENTVGKGEIACQECVRNTCTADTKNQALFGKGLNWFAKGIKHFTTEPGIKKFSCQKMILPRDSGGSWMKWILWIHNYVVVTVHNKESPSLLWLKLDSFLL